MNNIEYKNYKNIKICDSHLHLVLPTRLEGMVNKFREVMDYFCCERLGLMCLTHASGHRQYDYTNNIKALYIKSVLNSERPDSIYVYGNHINFYDERDTADSFLQQVKNMYEMGVDGYKSLDGNPANRKAIGKPLCDSVFDKMYSFIEQHNMPIKMHLGQPPTAWGPKSTITPYALSRGWWYGDGTYPSLEEHRAEVDAILTKFPKLKLCLAHFYFLGHDIDAAANFFEKWENVSFDLTPGKAMYIGFSEKHDEWREFFKKYSHRIYLGTDTYNGEVEGDDLSKYHEDENQRLNLVRSMLEKPYKEGYVDAAGTQLYPLELEDDILKNIYIENHKKLHPQPRPLNKNAILKEGEALLCGIKERTIPFETEEEYALEEENMKVIIDYFEKL